VLRPLVGQFCRSDHGEGSGALQHRGSLAGRLEVPWRNSVL